LTLSGKISYFTFSSFYAILIHIILKEDEEMTSKQRAYLRGLANTLQPIFQIGKSGLSDNLIKQLDDALEARELIKISVLGTAPDDVKSLGEEIATSTHSICVQTVGNKITLYRAKKKDSKIILPE